MVKSGNESKYSEFGCSAFFFITPKCVKREKHTGVYAYIRMLGNTYEVPSTLPGILINTQKTLTITLVIFIMLRGQ